MNSNQKNILVYTHTGDQTEPLLMGELTATIIRGKEIFSFQYTQTFLESEWTFDIDPNLQLFRGTQYIQDDQRNFGIFLDSSPDRWGRVLMDRKAAVMARLEERTPRRLIESDYLLGVYDESRMGALRFKTDFEGPFLDNDERNAAPPWTTLRELEHASSELEKDDFEINEKYLHHLNLLIAPGSSLGGARPKASVRDEKGALWIAKFPSRNDEVDIGAWEYLVHNLAIESGVKMAESRAEIFFSTRHTFLTKRFDRDHEGNRIHFFSAMTLLGYQDGADAQAGVSYLELAEIIQSRGSEPDKDLRQLWRRVVFNICVSNTDDHLRNHGFIISKSGGLQLSPAYDINPNPKGYGLNLNIDENDNSLNIDLARSVAPYFRMSDKKAQEVITHIQDIVKRWKELAEKIGISRREQELMRPAFSRA